MRGVKGRVANGGDERMTAADCEMAVPDSLYISDHVDVVRLSILEETSEEGGRQRWLCEHRLVT